MSADSTTASELTATLARLKSAFRKEPSPSLDARLQNLRALEKALLKHKDDFARSISQDFGNRSRHETLSVEVFGTLSGIKHTKAHLSEWMEVEPRDVGWAFLPASAEVIKQPLGVIGVISPWNYPLFLAFGPLAGALAAGNRAMLKPSELTPATSALLKRVISETFSPDLVTVVTGGVDVAVEFSKLPFDHLVFTGSTSVGKMVMRAAAENLVPVTLELGGKSPAIVSEGYSVKEAAEKIMFGRLFNAGQTCVAPDYAIVHRSKRDAFVEECKAAVTKFYPTLKDNADYTSIVNDRQHARLQGLLTEAKEKGATIVELNPAAESFEGTRKMAPTLVLDGTDDMSIMQDEIFGPFLPIVAVDSLDQAIDYVNDRQRPLALYYFDHDGERIEKVLSSTTSGGVTINDTAMHPIIDDLPFGGVGASGMGHYHAKEGFETFTKKKSVFRQARISGTSMLRPPFKGVVDTFLRLMLGK